MHPQALKRGHVPASVVSELVDPSGGVKRQFSNLHPQALKAFRRLAHVQRALLVNVFQVMSSLVAERVERENVSERIAKVVQCITCVAGASTMQSLATALAKFAKTTYTDWPSGPSNFGWEVFAVG